MTHLHEGRLRAWLDGEIPEAEVQEIERWLRDDPVARQALDGLRARDRRVSELLRRLDVAPPTARVRAAVEAERSRVARRTPAPPSARRIPGRRLAQAAILVLLLAGAASAAIPGSPVRDLLTGLFGPDAGPGEAALPTSVEAPEDRADPAGEEASVRVAPRDGRVRVELTGLPRGAEVRVVLVSGPRAAVYGPAGTEWETGTGWVRAELPGGPVRVELPRDVGAADLLVDGRVYMFKRGDRMDLRVPAADSSATEIRFRAGS